MTIRPLDARCYHAAEGFLAHLLKELGDRDRLDGDLVTSSGPERQAFWTRNVWREPLLVRFSGKEEAAEALLSLAPR